ncbi:EutN/CcmL family microcompartment protein [candidate division KSB1 bacterium]|nr:EutN/CcmL family microcompartment protein [candidate division KSB1 bacterium]
MELARVEGTVVSTIKSERLKGLKLLLVNLLGPDMKPTNNYVVAVDSVGAGVSEVVIIVRGSSARQTANLSAVPTDTSIVAIVDTVEFKGKAVYQKSAQ